MILARTPFRFLGQGEEKGKNLKARHAQILPRWPWERQRMGDNPFVANGSKGLCERWGAQHRPTALEQNCPTRSPTAFSTWRERLRLGLTPRHGWVACMKVTWHMSLLKQPRYSLSPKLQGSPRGRHPCLQVVKSDLEHQPQGRKYFGILSASLQNKFISIPGKLQGRV